MITTVLATIGSVLGPILLRMGIAAIGKNVIEESIISLLDFAVQKYKAHALKTEDPSDDETAKRLERIYEVWKDELGRLEAKGK